MKELDPRQEQYLQQLERVSVMRDVVIENTRNPSILWVIDTNGRMGKDITPQLKSGLEIALRARTNDLIGEGHVDKVIELTGRLEHRAKQK